MLIGWLLACGGGEAADDHADEARSHAKHEGHEHEAHEGHPKHESHGKQGGHGEHATAHHRFDDAEKWAEVFDDPERDGWQKPAVVVEALDLHAGMTVADIGAGTGYFNPHLAAAVGAGGTVIAIDIEDAMVAYMTQRATKDGTPQVKPRKAPLDAPALTPAEADRVLIVDTYHHIGDRSSYFAKVKSGTKAGGKLVVVDLTHEAPFGPPVSERLTAEVVKAELNEAGWVFERAVVGLPHQYVLVFGT